MIETSTNFLQSHWGDLGLSAHGRPQQFSMLLLTPQFRASRHVVMLLVAQGKKKPSLVLKVSRRQSDHGACEREASNLRAFHRHARLADTAPRCLDHGEFDGWSFLLQSGVGGKLLDPRRFGIRRSFYCSTVLEWLTNMPRGSSAETFNWDTHIAGTVEAIAERSHLWSPAKHVLDRARVALKRLCEIPLPRVFEHGDLSHPNLLWQPAGQLGVVDWELADRDGFPATDLFFFLNYAASTGWSFRGHTRRRPVGDLLGQHSWVLSCVKRYFRDLQLPLVAARPLLVWCWTRHVARLLVASESTQSTQDNNPTAASIHDHWMLATWERAVNDQDLQLDMGPRERSHLCVSST